MNVRRSSPTQERAFALAGAVMALWLGAVLMTGASAAIAFPAMKSLGPALADYPGHESEHWSIAAGHVMMPVFRVLDIATIVLASAALALGAFTVMTRHGRVGRVLWVVALLGAVSLGTHHALVRSPQMQRDASAYWDAARSGDSASAAEHKAAFDEMHPIASNVLKAEAALLALAIAGWAIAPRRAQPADAVAP